MDSNIYKFRFFLAACVLAFAVVTSGANTNIIGMSESEKVETIKNFEKVLTEEKYKVELRKTLEITSGEKIGGKHQEKENLYFKNGKYKIHLWYVLDRDFPIKYSGSGFEENQSEAFYNIWLKIISEHYLGSGYQSFEPEIDAITTVCIMDVLVSTKEELETLLKDSRIIKATHVGTPYVSVEVTR